MPHCSTNLSWYTLPQTTSLSISLDGPLFTYIDSGVPSSTIFAEPYTTIIATHGLAYNAHIFSRILALAPQHNLRVVAVNRRCYGGSTAFAQEQISAIHTASDEEKAAFVRTSGIDFATFVHKFISANDIPPASPDGKSGGVAFLGWSAGHGVIMSALANLEHTSTIIQARFKSHVRRFIMQEPPAPILGLPMPPGAWFFEMDESIPLEHRRRMGTIWITSYFDHGDLTSRDPSVLSYIVPSITRAPTIYNMSSQEFSTIVDETVSELEVMAFCGKQSNDNYLKACFDRTAREAVPHMSVHALCGTKGPSFSPAAFWDMQNDDNARGGGHISYKMIPGANHFMHWDDYELAMKAYLEALA